MKRFILVVLALTSCATVTSKPEQVKFTPIKISIDRVCGRYNNCSDSYKVVGANLEYYSLGNDNKGKMRSEAIALKLNEPVWAIIQYSSLDGNYIKQLC